MTKIGFNSGNTYNIDTVEWSAEGYVIVVPAGNDAVLKSASLLKAFYKAQGVELEIVEDTAAETAKEILVGETNRTVREYRLKEGIVASYLEGERLVITGGHNVTVDSAVKRFIRLKPALGEAVTFEEFTDFQSKKPGGYEYVWGDEFEGSDIDMTKWCFEKRMRGTEQMKLAYDKDVIKVYDGHATLRAMHYTDPDDPKVMYKIPRSLCTLYTMNFDYGYAEIRAKVPFINGVWPSFWATTACNISGRRNMQWHAEIDCFEMNGSPNVMSSTIHKWYDEFDYKSAYGIDRRHSHFPRYDRVNWIAPNPDTINDQWHTYGFEKTETAVNIYVDRNFVGSFDIVNSFDAHPDMSVFQDPVFLIMNNHAMSDDSWYKPSLISDNPEKLPADYHIDWVRLYMKPDKGTLYTDETPGDYPER